MRRCVAIATAVVSAAAVPSLLAGSAAAAVRSPAAAAVPAGARAAASAGTWGKLVDLTGAGLNSGGDAEVNSVSCASAGNCSAGGFYEASSGGQAFVASEVSGTWGIAKEVPGLGSLVKGAGGAVNSVSCASAGNCTAGGYYDDASHQFQAFVVSQKNGTWGNAKEVPGSAALNSGEDADVNSVSCASAGNCAVGGSYRDASGHLQAFVVSEVKGTWGTAAEIPGTAALNAGGYAVVESVSCAPAGTCAADGFYRDASTDDQAFVVSEKNGTWGTAVQIPGTAALNAGGSAQALSVSCASSGNCGAGGSYRDASALYQAFVVSEKNGVWGSAREVPGTASLNAGGSARVESVSCASAGNCSASGSYEDASPGQQAFVVSENNGTWGTAIQAPGTAALNAGHQADIMSVACRSAGNCTAGGMYEDRLGASQPLVISQVNGTWGKATPVPGAAALIRSGDGGVLSVSCGSAGNCSAGGYYYDAADFTQAFVASQASGKWGKAIEVPGTRVLNEGGSAATNAIACGSAGNCSAGGYYSDGVSDQAFVARQVSGKWSTAEVPGSAALNKGGDAGTAAVACGSAGNCAAGGFYADGSGHYQVFLVSQVKGTWGTAKEMPGSAALNAGGNAEINALACASAGSCGAGGYYRDGAGHLQAFVVSEAKGTWGTAKEVPGSAALNAGGNAQVASLACGSAGDCSAGGFYTDGSGHKQAFVVTQGNGAWGNAKEVKGSAALNAGGGAAIQSVACGSAGSCSAGGYYTDGSGHKQAFVVGRGGGTWGTAVEVPGTAVLNAGGDAVVNAVSCTSAGNCAAVGSYADSGGLGSDQPFAVSQVKGTWGTARQVPVTGLGTGSHGYLGLLSCSSAGNCTAAGQYFANATNGAFVVSQVKGRWGTSAALAGAIDIYALSCVPAGQCAAAGDYLLPDLGYEGYAVSRS